MKELIIHDPHFSSNRIVVMLPSGVLEIIFTPISAFSIEAVKKLPKDSKVKIEAVFGTTSASIIYQIDGDYFYHFHFVIINSH